LAGGLDGDWQIAQWLKKRNQLNLLSRFKIFDNLRRSLVPVFVMMLILWDVGAGALTCPGTRGLVPLQIILIALISLTMPAILDILNYIVFRENVESSRILAHKNMVPVISSIKSSIIRGVLDIVFLPDKAYTAAANIIKALYRKYISKKNLLEWVTSEEAEKQAKTNLKSYYRHMWFNVVIGILLIAGAGLAPAAIGGMPVGQGGFHLHGYLRAGAPTNNFRGIMGFGANSGMVYKQTI